MITTAGGTDEQSKARGASRVLVVEDDADTADVVAMLLEAHGHRCVTASDADAALAIVRESPPDVALIDIGLRGTNGFELAERIRGSAAPGVRMAAMTGYVGDEYRARARAAGFDMILAKPVDIDQLLAAITSLRTTRA